jgi:hypothetical protein
MSERDTAFTERERGYVNVRGFSKLRSAKVGRPRDEVAIERTVALLTTCTRSFVVHGDVEANPPPSPPVAVMVMGEAPITTNGSQVAAPAQDTEVVATEPRSEGVPAFVQYERCPTVGTDEVLTVPVPPEPAVAERIPPEKVRLSPMPTVFMRSVPSP